MLETLGNKGYVSQRHWKRISLSLVIIKEAILVSTGCMNTSLKLYIYSTYLISSENILSIA